MAASFVPVPSIPRGISRPRHFYAELFTEQPLTREQILLIYDGNNKLEMLYNVKLPKPLYNDMTSNRRQMRAFAGARTPRPSISKSPRAKKENPWSPALAAGTNEMTFYYP
jgi:hypothetical protein